MRLTIWLGCAAMMLAMLVGCQMNPATGQRNFNVFSEGQEIRLGAEAQPEFLRDYGGPIPSPAVQAYVNNLGQQLARESERAGLPWEFHVVDSNVINAFALPGGKIFLTRGILAKFKSEAELAGVLGHEIGHVTAQHMGQQMSQRLVVSGVLIGLGVAAQTSDEDWLKIMGVGTQIGGSLYLLSFGRDQEMQADELGVRYMTRLGYNPMGLVRVMEMFREEESAGGRPPEFLSTHPAPQSRIDRLMSHIEMRYPDYNDTSRYRMDEANYKRMVLDELAKLPKARHSAK